MNRRDFLRNTVGALVVAPVLASAQSTARDINADFNLPEAKGLTDYLKANSMGKNLRVESTILNDVVRSFSGDDAYHRIFLGESELGTLTTCNDGRKPVFIGILPVDGKLTNEFAISSPYTGDVYRGERLLVNLFG